MIDQPRMSIASIAKDDIIIKYNIIFKNALYSLECYKEGSDMDSIMDYCFIEDFTDDEGEAESFLHRIARGTALPVHIKDLVEDFID